MKLFFLGICRNALFYSFIADNCYISYRAPNRQVGIERKLQGKEVKMESHII